jgi:hypothetical protein
MAAEDRIDTHNIYVEESGHFVSIRVNPRLYRKDIIMRAADDLIHNEHLSVDAIIDGDPEKEIIAKFIPREGKKTKEDLLKIAHRFNSLLIASSGKG